MKRPFYVHTPRNCFGESLVSKYTPAASCGYTVRNVLDESKADKTKPTKNIATAERQCKRLNDQHEVEMMAGMI